MTNPKTCAHPNTDESYRWDDDINSEVPFLECLDCKAEVVYDRIQGYSLTEGDVIQGLGVVGYTFQTNDWKVVFEIEGSAVTHTFDLDHWFDVVAPATDEVFDQAIRALRRSEPRLARLLWVYATNEMILEG